VVAIPNRAYPPAADVLSQADLVLDAISDLPDALGSRRDHRPELGGGC